ncbi:uncharacterized protein [Engystomops pustulosus]|uniref:uncharacterized protein isoform X1 n=1 Tax=Engystomops pustulosus TaxID=76066 RepID=UPI003AFAD0F9
MSTQPRLLVPYGLKTLLEGLSRAVVRAQPADITHFAMFYFAQLLQYRQENPSMDFKNLVQEFQHRQETSQIQFDQAESPKSGIPYTPDLKTNERSEKEQRPLEQDPCKAMAEAMSASPDGALKYSTLHRNISNPLVGAGGVHSHIDPNQSSSSPAAAESKVSQLQEQTSLGAEVSSGKSVDEVSSKKQLSPTSTLKTKVFNNGTIPKMSNDQAVYVTEEQDPAVEYPVSPSVSDLIPVRIISKTRNVTNLPVDVHGVVSFISQQPADQAHSSSPGSAIHSDQEYRESQMPQKKRSRPTENQQRTGGIQSTNLYRIHISVDKQGSEDHYEPAYIPGKGGSMVHIVTAVPTQKTGPRAVSETPSVYYKAATMLTSHENIQSPVLCRHRSQDPMQYRSVSVSSRPASSRQWLGQKTSPLQQPTYTYREAESPKNLRSPEAVNKQEHSDASTQSSASDIDLVCSGSVRENLIGSPGESDQADMRTSVNSEQPTSQTQKYMQRTSKVQPMLITSPTTSMTSDEAKRVLTSPPYIFVGSSECKNGQATMPASFPRNQTNTGNRMQNFHRDPVYISVEEPVDQVESMSATLSATHLAETRSIASFAEDGNTIAVAVTATRCPSIIHGPENENSMASPDDEGCIKPFKTEDTIA